MKRAVTVILAASACVIAAADAQANPKGEQIFNQKCAMCHVVKGKGGAIGPELTRVSAKLGEADIKAKLENPKSQKPSSSMPSFKSLSKPDMDALTGYLKTLK
jgi:mono/diheme cytochrome c family protein